MRALQSETQGKSTLPRGIIVRENSEPGRVSGKRKTKHIKKRCVSNHPTGKDIVAHGEKREA